MKIKTVFLDVDNTILDFNKCADESMLLAAAESGITFPENHFATFKRINDGLWQRVERGEITVDRLYEIRWNIIFGEMNINTDGVEFEAKFLRHLETSAVPVDGAVDMMAQLSKKYKLCIASNAPLGQQKKRLEKAGMMPYIDRIFASGDLGVAKPAKEFFLKCLEKSETRADEAVMIGDSLKADISGAAACGIKTVWLNFDGTTPSESIKPDFTVSSHLEVCKIL